MYDYPKVGSREWEKRFGKYRGMTDEQIDAFEAEKARREYERQKAHPIGVCGGIDGRVWLAVIAGIWVLAFIIGCSV